MIIILGLVLGALIGGFNARRANGTRLDILQYAVVGLLIGGVVATFITLGVERMT